MYVLVCCIPCTPGIFPFISVLIFEFGSLSPLCCAVMISTSNDCSLVSHTLIQYGNVPLVMAASKGHTNTVQRLLEAGANVNHQNRVMTIILCTYFDVTEQQHIGVFSRFLATKTLNEANFRC